MKCESCGNMCEKVFEVKIKAIKDLWIDVCEDCKNMIEYENTQLNKMEVKNGHN